MTEELCQIQNRQRGKSKWTTVGYFTHEPKESPTYSKEMVEVAKFTGEGDAWLYAQMLARRPGARHWWAVVIR